MLLTLICISFPCFSMNQQQRREHQERHKQRWKEQRKKEKENAPKEPGFMEKYLSTSALYSLMGWGKNIAVDAATKVAADKASEYLGAKVDELIKGDEEPSNPMFVSLSDL